MIALSGNTDCYQPVERQLGLTRRCLEVFGEFRNPVAIITKSALVTRDADLLGILPRTRRRTSACRSPVSMSSWPAAWSRARRAGTALRSDPGTERRRACPRGVMVAPVIPGLNDAEIPAHPRSTAPTPAPAAPRGSCCASPSRSIGCSATGWRTLSRTPPRVLGRIRECRAGHLSDAHSAAACAARACTPSRSPRCSRTRPGAAVSTSPLPPLTAAAFRRPPQAGEQLRLC